MGLACGGGESEVTAYHGTSAAPAPAMAPTALLFESEASAAPHSPFAPTPSAQGRDHRHFVPTQVPLTEVIEPLDFEDVLLSRPPDAEPGPLRDLVEFPADDLELLLQPRECRTTEPGIPEDEWVQPQAVPVHNSIPPPRTAPSSVPPFPSSSQQP